MAIRYFRNGPATTLVASVGSEDTIITVDDASGFPTLFPYTLILDKDQATEEVVDATAAAGNQLTIVRGVDSTTAFPHNAGALVVHGTSARDPREANSHGNATGAVHGVSGDLVGTTDVQTLTGKTLTSPTVSGGTITNAAIVGGSVASSSAVTLSENSKVQPTTAGAKFSLRDSGGVERGFIDGNGHTQLPRLEVVGTSTTLPTLKAKGAASQTANLLTVEDSAASAALTISSGRRMGVNTTPGGSTTLWVKAADNADIGLQVTGASASQTADLFRVTTSSLSPVLVVSPTGNFSVAGNISSADFTDWATYTPLWTNADGSTFATRTGRWKRIGKKTVAFSIYVDMATSGSGSGLVTTTLPTVPDRTIRQTFAGHSESPGMVLQAITQTGGSGTTVERILQVSATATNSLIGSDCVAGRLFTISGFYEEA